MNWKKFSEEQPGHMERFLTQVREGDATVLYIAEYLSKRWDFEAQKLIDLPFAEHVVHVHEGFPPKISLKYDMDDFKNTPWLRLNDLLPNPENKSIALCR